MKNAVIGFACALCAVMVVAFYATDSQPQTSSIELTVIRTGERITVSDEHLLTNLGSPETGDTVTVIKKVCPGATGGYIEWEIPVQTKNIALGETTLSGTTGNCSYVTFKAIVSKKM